VYCWIVRCASQGYQSLKRVSVTTWTSTRLSQRPRNLSVGDGIGRNRKALRDGHINILGGYDMSNIINT
jgi:hypothetical protein